MSMVHQKIRPFTVWLFSAVSMLFASGFGAAHAADAAHPTVVELFQSQGCSSCPPANANLNELTKRPDVLALSFGVTYWDDLGWKDTFAKPQYTARQWEYAHGLGHSEVWTPQVVVNGHVDVVGTRQEQIENAIAKADRGAGGPAIGFAGASVEISGATSGSADVWLVRYDPRSVNVAISRGENTGRTLPHRNVVKELIKLGNWRGGKTKFTLPDAAQAGLSTAVFIQSGPGGAIVAAARG